MNMFTRGTQIRIEGCKKHKPGMLIRAGFSIFVENRTIIVYKDREILLAISIFILQ